MRTRTLHFLPLLAVALAAVPAAAAAQDASPVEGAWLLESITAADGTEEMQHPGLFIYTATHYSTMFVIGDEARADMAVDEATPNAEPTDAEKVAAYNSFIANSGRYEIEGAQLTTRAYVAKFPNYMHAFPDNASTFTFAVDGDELTLTTQGDWVFTLRRVEGTPYPSGD